MTNKQQFLEDHNRLASAHLQVTTEMLTRFRVEKAALFKDRKNDWSTEKLRMPLIMWLTSYSEEDRKNMIKGV
jgi:hypothetical protein